ncbi:MAG TPA: M15 family metallopeptidase [Acidimicrobiia bacterium]|nr:M15 family metallopeptidase [Acidimicrobiia bacterium]
MTLTYWGFDNAAHTGELVVHAQVASRVAAAMNTLFQARFPIERMQLVDVYGGSDDASMAANNTSGFNCRLTTSGTRWSEHSYGRAIDINPIQNPYRSSNGTVLPPAGAPYVDRTRTDPGMIHDGDVVVQAFAAIGWGWGGHYQSIKDWQHFSSTGG